jgi:hypothetical protein
MQFGGVRTEYAPYERGWCAGMIKFRLSVMSRNNLLGDVGLVWQARCRGRC